MTPLSSVAGREGPHDSRCAGNGRSKLTENIYEAVVLADVGATRSERGASRAAMCHASAKAVMPHPLRRSPAPDVAAGTYTRLGDPRGLRCKSAPIRITHIQSVENNKGRKPCCYPARLR